MEGKKASELVKVEDGMEVLEFLRLCGGYYECPKDAGGKRLGPLVGYVGKYDDPKTGEKKQWVGDVYYNFASAEQYPHVIDELSLQLAKMIEECTLACDVILGAPVGGMSVAQNLARHLDRRYVFPDKKVTEVATETSREKSELIFGRHEIELGDRVLIAEDVVNNYTTTGVLCELIRSHGGDPVRIACLLNRSNVAEWEGLHVASLLYIPTEQYKQDDPEVAEDIAAGNVVWKPKDGWAKLEKAMADAQAASAT